MSDMFVGSQTPLYQNVKICRRSKTGKILEERYSKNRVTKLMLFGIAQFLIGTFNDSNPQKIYEMIPRFLSLGSNTPGPDSASSGVTKQPTVNDTRLLNEIKVSSTTGATEPVKRLWIAERNMLKINTKFSDPFIKVSIKTYVHEAAFDGMSIGEAGLFSKERDNNCLARVAFKPIIKNPGEVLDIQWDITLLSYGETKYPDSIKIQNGDRVAIPLQYTNKHFKETKLGLSIDKDLQIIGENNNGIISNFFKYDNDGVISNIMTLDDLKNTSWYIYLQSTDLRIEDIFRTLNDSKLNDINNPIYLISKTQNISHPYYFGNLYANDTMEYIESTELASFNLFSEDQEINNEDTMYRFTVDGSNVPGNFIIKNPDGKINKYRVNRFQIHEFNTATNQWEPLDAFMYNNVIVNSQAEPIGYSYSSNGIFFKSTITLHYTLTNQYLTYDENNEHKVLFTIGRNDLVIPSGYTFDFNDNAKIFLNDEFTLYHLSLDNYWVMGNYLKLIPIILPTDATDKSITWKIQNENIAKINFDGVVTSWNLGETTAIVSTSNELRAKTIIDVVKESRFVPVDDILLDPVEIELYVDGSLNQYHVVTATVLPLFATNPTVTWSTSYEISNCISLINLGNNQVKVILNGSGNLGTGFITATSQTGKSKDCLVRVIFMADSDDCDCPSPTHLEAEA